MGMNEASARGVDTRSSRLDAVAMVAIALASLAAKFVVLDPVGPLIFFDELLYKLGADALAAHGTYPSGHYPFLYPLLLAPAVASGTGYEGIFFINALATSTLVPACWLLARACGARWAWPCAVIAAVLPIQFTFPTQVFAENLFVPLFTFCVWYAVRAKPVGWLSAFAYGLMLAGIYLTKYLALPAVPVLWVAWLFGLSRNGVARAGLPRLALSSAAGVAVLVGAWVLYAGANGIGVQAAFGGDVYEGHADRSAITFDSLLLWTGAYLAVAVLLVGPFLYRLFEAVVELARNPVQRLGESAFYRLVLLCLLFLGGYLLVCVMHSAQLAMNYPDPQRVVVRYFMQLVPAVFVLGVVQALAGNGIGRLRPMAGVAAAVCLAALVVAAHGVLYKDFVWDFPDWFAAIPLYSTDILGYRQGVGFWLLPVVVLLGPLAATGAIGRWLVVSLGITLVVFSTAYVNRVSEVFTTSRPVHARELLPYVTDSLRKGDAVRIVSEIPRLPEQEISQALQFWGVDGSRIAGGAREQTAQAGTEAVYRLRIRPLEGERPLHQYAYGQGGYRSTGYIYRDQAPGAPETAAMPDARVAFTASPSQLCAAARAAVDLSWSVPADVASRVQIFVRATDGSERLFSSSAGAGTQRTGDWVFGGTEFRLRDADTGRVLSVLKVGSDDCAR